MPFLKINNADIAFGEGTFTCKFYTINKALPTIEQVQLVNPKEFVIAALDADSKIFVVHMAICNVVVTWSHYVISFVII